jgi:hypothetical protein
VLPLPNQPIAHAVAHSIVSSPALRQRSPIAVESRVLYQHRFSQPRIYQERSRPMLTKLAARFILYMLAIELAAFFVKAML